MARVHEQVAAPEAGIDACGWLSYE